MYRTRTLGLLVATAALGLSLTACSDDSSDSDGSSDQPASGYDFATLVRQRLAEAGVEVVPLRVVA